MDSPVESLADQHSAGTVCAVSHDHDHGHGHGHGHDHDHGHDHGHPVHDAGWEHAAAWARRLAWISLALVGAEGAIGLWQGLSTGSIALTGWALGAIPEGMAGAAVIWRFTGARAHSATSERRAQIAVAISFWLNAPYIAAAAVNHLLDREQVESSLIGIALTAIAVLVMPGVGRAQRRLAARLNSAATDGEGIQNYLCAIQAAAVLVGLLLTANWADGWWLDPIIGLGVAAVCVWQGFRSWRGEGCGC